MLKGIKRNLRLLTARVFPLSKDIVLRNSPGIMSKGKITLSFR